MDSNGIERTNGMEIIDSNGTFAVPCKVDGGTE